MSICMVGISTQVQYNLYVRVPNIFVLGCMMLMGVIFGVCAKFSLGRWLLEKVAAYQCLTYNRFKI